MADPFDLRLKTCPVQWWERLRVRPGLTRRDVIVLTPTKIERFHFEQYAVVHNIVTPGKPGHPLSSQGRHRAKVLQKVVSGQG